MSLPDDGAFFDDIDGDMAEQEAIVAALEAQRKRITAEGLAGLRQPQQFQRASWAEIEAALADDSPADPDPNN
jgi:hypothetical protein